jgi:hypothetical protein
MRFGNVRRFYTKSISPPTGTGKLASASITAGPSAGYQRAFAYDNLGRPASVTFTVDGTA